MNKFSFICGMVTAFCECVAAGVKPIALSPPMERADFIMVRGECARIVERHGLRWFHEENADLNAPVRRDWMVIYARDGAIREYAQKRAAGESPARDLSAFAELLGYTESRIATGYDAYREYFDTVRSDRMNILVSACLLGIHCRYNGDTKTANRVLALADRHTLIPFCPETYGGLPTPREPSEIRDGRVLTRSGADVTAQFELGAHETLKTARLLGCTLAILQDRSPSCGAGVIHNGLFDGGLVEGDGIAAKLLRENGIRVLRASDPEVDTL